MEVVKQWCYSALCCLCVWSWMAASSSNILVEASHSSNRERDSLRAVHPISHVRRTGYHFQPPQHWINDPNGPMYYNGVYHLFYQYNPKGSVWGNIVWAHSVSEDLINWISLKPAITPSKDFDIQGCWSGSATILPGNKPVLFYTGLDPQYNQVQNLAFPANLSDPYLRDWVKPDFNPVIVPGPDTNTSAFRDPTTAWWNHGYWKTVVGSRDNGITGMARLYKSRDFKNWVRAEEPLHKAENTGMWECPDFYPVWIGRRKGAETSVVGLGVKHVLKVSLDLTRFEYYTIGEYDVMRDKYVPDSGMVDGWGGLRYDYGNFYASKTFFDLRGKRRILWGWANESDAQSEDVKKGWAGIQLIPREIWLDPNGKQLLQWPIDEVELLRTNPVISHQLKLNMGDAPEIQGVTAAQADVEVVFKLPQSLENAEPFDPSWVNSTAQDICAQRGSNFQGGIGPFGLLTLASEFLEEYTPVFFRIFKTQDNDKHKVLMCSDASRSTLLKDPCETIPECMYKPSFAGFVDVDLTDRKLALRSLIDHSVVESFGAKGKTCITSRVYPTKAVGTDAHLYLFNNGTEPITVEKLEAWSMQNPLKMNQPLDEISF